MNKKKIINDPVYGFISIPTELIFDLIEDPWFQRLRRIKQMGLAHFVYPGALHTRFHHALGAMHLMQEAIRVLRSKGVDVADDEEESALIAILLHDIGHGPYSHAMEGTLLNVHHEVLTLHYMKLLQKKYGDIVEKAIAIYQGTYPKSFLHQLVSSQLDMDRMDYLKRDSFFTGVAEGVIGHDRIIKMLNVRDDMIVVEEKGIYSIEKFLVARRLMYWQVYLHKTALAAEQMLRKLIERVRAHGIPEELSAISRPLARLLKHDYGESELMENTDHLITLFSSIDDVDILMLIKKLRDTADPVIRLLAGGLLHRRLFACELTNAPADLQHKRAITAKVQAGLGIDAEQVAELILEGSETNQIYQKNNREIRILKKDGSVSPLSAFTETEINARLIRKYYLCYPKLRNLL